MAGLRNRSDADDDAAVGGIGAMRFSAFLIGSLIAAAASAGLPYLLESSDPALFSLPFCLAWSAVTGVALWRFRWGALWLLVGAPAAFYWPFLFAMIAIGCARNVRACP